MVVGMGARRLEESDEVGVDGGLFVVHSGWRLERYGLYDMR